jgi:ABC-type glycerol-3-phosphate transport system substrate-binding protein
MGDRETIAEQILARQLSRRSMLKVSAAVPIGAALASLVGAGSRVMAQDAPDFTGTTLRVWGGGTTSPPAEKAGAEWAALTGGQVIVERIPFEERAVRFAGLISSQDGSVDLLATSGDYAGRFGDRLYDNLSDPALGIDTSVFVPAILPILTSDGGLRGLPLHSEMLIYIYNKAMFEAAGLDPENPPSTWEELYASADALKDGDRFATQVPWQVSYGGAPFYLMFLNSIPGARLLSDDRTQVLFGDDNGLRAFQAIEAGIKAGFFDPNLAPDIEDYAIGGNFNNERTASMVNFAELWGYATGGDPTNFPTTIAPENVGATIVPGIDAGTSGSINGFEGFGINRFGTQKEAALHFLQYISGPEYQKAMNLAKTLPSSRTAVLNDPEVVEVYPVGAVLAEQGTHNLERYASPYDWTPPISDAVGKLYRGEITAEQAHEESVAKVNEIVLNYLAS